MRSVGLFLLGVLCLPITACVDVRITERSDLPSVQTRTAQVPATLLLDVAIVVLDPGLDDYDDDEQSFPELRKAESYFMPLQIAEAMQGSGAWGAVRVVPNDSQITDLIVTGKILHSDGEQLQLNIVATDSRGRMWLDKTYSANANRLDYELPRHYLVEPFLSLYRTIANELLRIADSLNIDDRYTIRTVTELRYAEYVSPNAFTGYIEKSREGEYEIRRVPAEADPMLARVQQIRDRDHIYVDTLQGYFSNFSEEMKVDYWKWREKSYPQILERKKNEKRAQQQLIVGGIDLVAGLTTATGGYGAGVLLKDGLEIRNEAQYQVAALEQLSADIEAEASPQVIELEDQTVTLSGNVEQQYDQWRELLADIYRAEIGELASPEESPNSADAL